MEPQTIKKAIADETNRIEEDALHSMKGHFNAGSRWERAHLVLGVPSVILAASAGIDALSDSPELTAFLAFSAAALTATITFIKLSNFLTHPLVVSVLGGAASSLPLGG